MNVMPKSTLINVGTATVFSTKVAQENETPYYGINIYVETATLESEIMMFNARGLLAREITDEEYKNHPDGYTRFQNVSWDFLERNLPNYSSSEEVAHNNRLAAYVLDGNEPDESDWKEWMHSRPLFVDEAQHAYSLLAESTTKLAKEVNASDDAEETVHN